MDKGEYGAWEIKGTRYIVIMHEFEQFLPNKAIAAHPDWILGRKVETFDIPTKKLRISTTEQDKIKKIVSVNGWYALEVNLKPI